MDIPNENNINLAEVRMYKLGTGDCFIIKFFAGEEERFKMMIDAGVWQRKGAELKPYIEDLLEYVDNHVHLLVITHEHQDHVLAFERCKDLFTKKFKVDKIWMGWTENEDDPKVKEWKDKYGEKKKALAFAAHKLKETVEDKAFEEEFLGSKFSKELFKFRQYFSETLSDFANLHSDTPLNANDKVYKGGLKGMEIVKNQIANGNIEYRRPGEIIRGTFNSIGLKFYILGPPLLYEEVKEEEGEAGEAYEHNRELEAGEAFAAAVTNGQENILSSQTLPFDSKYILQEKANPTVKKWYNNDKSSWRKIDHDWLYSASNLALRMNSLTNNLSLALAIEFENSGKIMLFPGDAEFGSWQSWHKIEWEEDACEGGKKISTQDLLNQTVFYKVAHHLSHNGTARSIGLEMMTHPDLAAMATLDYEIISNGWKSTMPNQAIIDDLLQKTSGRLMIMNEKDLQHRNASMTETIEATRDKMAPATKKAFEDNLEITDHYIQYRVNGG